MASKKQVTNKLQQIGAAWAGRDDKYVSPNDPFDSKPMYHVHPDSSYPHQSDIKRFANLDEIAGYVEACQAAAAAKDDIESAEIMQNFWAEIG